MTEAQEFAMTYPTIINAKQTFERVKPVLEAIFKFKETGTRFTPAMIGEAVLGDEYHQVVTHQNWRGDTISKRTPKAYSVSSTIGHALHMLRKAGLVTYKTEKDMDHPHTYEDEAYGYALCGAPIPEIIRVCINGAWVAVEARNLEGVERKWTKREVTRYPSIDWYTFK